MYNRDMITERPEGCAVNPVIVMPLAPARRNEMITLLKALADETRLEVFRFIAGQVEPVCVCDIVDRFDVSQPTISHHLKVLREASLVTASRRGNWAFYEVDQAGLQRASEQVGTLLPAHAAV